MRRSIHFAQLLSLVLPFLLLCLTPLGAQPGGTCLLSFEPEYMGAGNCYRVILKNSDPQLSPYSVQYWSLDEGAIEVGNVEPRREWGRDQHDTWYFTGHNALEAGEVDTGYFCYVASVSSVRLAVAWADVTGSILCRDTLHLAMPHVAQSCFEVTEVDMFCAFPVTESVDAALSKKSNFSFLLPIQISVNLLNRSGEAVSSTLLSGPDCTSGIGSIEVQRFPTPLAPGAETGFVHWGRMSPDDPICFDVDDAGWNLIPLEITLQDETNADICSDSVVILISEFACASGGVADFTNQDYSAMDLHVVNHDAGEMSVSFTLEERSNLRLSLVDMVGNELRRLIDDQLFEEGESGMTFTTEGIPSGTYVLLLQVGERSQGKVVQIVR